MLLLAPADLCFDWSMDCVRLVREWTDPRLSAVLPLWAALRGMLPLWAALGGGTLAWKSLNGDRRATAACALALVPFLPASNLLVTVGFVVAERNLCLLVALGRDRLRRRWPKK